MSLFNSDESSASSLPAVNFGHGTHVGLKRDHNEDTYCTVPEIGLWLVADGMGGHEHGEVASALARDSISQSVGKGESLKVAIINANNTIIDRSQSSTGEVLPMGTTVVVVQTNQTDFELAWVGDSRAYICNQQGLKQISSDHSYVQELVEQGAISPEQARVHPHRNVVTQALGVTDAQDLVVETANEKLSPGLQILLCSDGLTEEVADEQIETILSAEIGAQEAVDQLILAAVDNGGSDNITAVLLRIPPEISA